MEIFIAVAGLTDGQRDGLRQALAGHELIFHPPLSGEAPPARLKAAQVIFGNVPAGWLEVAAGLQWMQLDSAGFDSFLPVFRTRNPALLATNLRDFYGSAVAETLVAGLLAFYRQLPALLNAQSSRRWIKSEIEPRIDRLGGKRVVILGAGGIGRRVGDLCRAFGCPVDHFARKTPAALRSLPQLDEALGRTDVLINTLPQTPETIGLLDAARLSRLPSAAVFVNGGRGSVVDEAALIARLASGALRGAVLDVTGTEPLPVENPLWTLANVILTQHTSGRFSGETDAKIEVFLENLRRFIGRQTLNHLIDLSRDY